MAAIIDITAYRAGGEPGEMTKLEFEAKRVYLEGYLSLTRQARDTAEELTRLYHDIGPGAAMADGMPRGGKKTDGSDRIIGRMESMKHMCTAMKREIADMEKKRAVIAAAIDGLAPGNCWETMRLIYLQGMDIGAVAEEMHYSYRQIQNFHKRAVMRVKLPAYEIKKIKESLMEEHPEWANIDMKAA